MRKILLLISVIAFASRSMHDGRYRDDFKHKWRKCEQPFTMGALTSQGLYYYDSTECTLKDWPDNKVVVDFYYPNDTIK